MVALIRRGPVNMIVKLQIAEFSYTESAYLRHQENVQLAEVKFTASTNSDFFVRSVASFSASSPERLAAHFAFF